MADVHTKEQRSRNMAAIRSRGNKSTEIALATLLRQQNITGWRRHYKKLPGTPDFVFPQKQIAVFVEGCFWHGCPKCKPSPKSNVGYWKNKIENNIRRDKKNRALIKKRGWIVIRVWEHQLKSPKRLSSSLFKKITSRSS